MQVKQAYRKPTLSKSSPKFNDQFNSVILLHEAVKNKKLSERYFWSYNAIVSTQLNTMLGESTSISYFYWCIWQGNMGVVARNFFSCADLLSSDFPFPHIVLLTRFLLLGYTCVVFPC